MIVAASIDTRDGVFHATFSDRGLTRLSFPGQPMDDAHDPAIPEAWLEDTMKALRAVLAGQAPKRLPPLDLSHGTGFQQKVWQAMLAIPVGSTRSYGELAASIGTPGASRAVGSACGANRIPVLVPCHRVLAANQRLGGFSAGLEWKRLLLERERAHYIVPRVPQTC